MSLKEAVIFRHLTSMLNDHEKSSFLSGLIKEQPELLIESLFNHFKSESTEPALCVEINKKISEIINSRESKQENKQHDICISLTIPKLNEVSEPVISKIASYLTQIDYSNLCKVSREMFIGCQSPNSLQSIYFDPEGNKNYYPFNCNLYSSVKHFDFDLSQYEYRCDQFIQSSFLDQLQSITFSGNSSPDQFWTYDFEEFPICKNMKTLCLQYWSEKIKVSDNFFQKFLSKFPNIQYLELQCVCHVNFNFIKSLFPELKGLSVSNGHYTEPLKYKQLIHDLGENLEYLDFQGEYGNVSNNLNYEFGNIRFYKLQELRLRSVNVNTLNDIFRSTQNLKKVSFSLLSVARESIFFDQQRQDAISKLIINSPLLEYVHIYELATNYMLSILKGIEVGLKQTKCLHRRKFKIRISMRGYPEQYNPLDLVFHVFSLVNIMKSVNIENYMFIWDEIPDEKLKEIRAKFGSDAILTRGCWSTHMMVFHDKMNKFKNGDRVKLIDLKSKDHWNGLIGYIVGSFSKSKKRWPVEVIEDIDGNMRKQKALLKETNLVRWNGNNKIDDDYEYRSNINGYSESWKM
eukprot:76750_1